jgi:RNA polymerase sigma-70 factor (ECF subfamily)
MTVPALSTNPPAGIDLGAVRAAREAQHRDAALVQAAAAGDPGAQRTLYDRHVDRVYRLAYRMTGDGDMAADVTQDTFIRAFERLGEFRQEAAFGTWLHRIAVTTALVAIRSRKRRDRRYRPLEDADDVGQTDPQGEVLLREHLDRAIDGLADGYRTVFVMYELEGYSHQEIADTLGVAVATSKGQLFRAKARLREALKQVAAEVREGRRKE